MDGLKMEQFPHDYLTSELKDEIEIRFYRRGKCNFLELEYRASIKESNKKRFYTSKRRISNPKSIYDELRFAEAALVKEIRKSDAQREAEREYSDRKIDEQLEKLKNQRS